MNISGWLALAVLAFGVGGCGADDGRPLHSPVPLEVRLPRSFPPMFVPVDNPTTYEGVALGRKLYYDRRLSPDGSRACADCHLQEHAFSSTVVPGVLPHINLAWSWNFLWDGKFEGTLEEVMIMEVEEFFDTDVERLREPDLEEMFLAAFGSPEITTKRAGYAIAQFQRTLVSRDSRFDGYVAGDEAALSESEFRGMALFYSERGECFHCHATSLFTDNRFHNIGLDADVAGTGRGAVTGRARDDGLYKTPTLRNVEMTAPYMHDDRFATLEEVIDFYSEGVIYSDTIDSLIPNVTGGGLHLTAQERLDLVAFLRALTDPAFLSNPELARP
jgi:cytochrome c peroxidase